MFSLKGIFNPLVAHRQHRVLRRHSSLLAYLSRATASRSRWVPTAQTRGKLHADALCNWFH